MRIFGNLLLSKEDREIKSMNKSEARAEIDRMVRKKGPNKAFLVNDGSSQRFWKLKEKIGEGIN